jgi:hypothetical protein
MYSNIKLEHEPVGDGWELKLHPTLEPLAYAVAEKHPDWMLSVNYASRQYDNKVAWVMELQVSITATEELLGQIGVETRRKRGEHAREYVFAVYNKRIAEKRDRGTTFKTGKLKDALKQIHKNFYPKTLVDKIDEAWGMASNIAGRAAGQAERDVDYAHRILMEPGVRFLKDKYWEEFKSTLEDTGAIKAHTELAGLIDRANDLSDIHTKLQQHKLLTVTIKDDKYTVAKSPTEIKEYLADDVPEDVRRQVGMLKLVAEHEVVPGVGLRVGEMYIIDAAY